MDNLANGHDSEVEAPSAALQEVDLNGVPMTNGSHSTKDRDTEPDGVLDANQDSGDDDHEDREQGEDGVGQAELTTGLAPKKKKKKRKPKSKRGIVYIAFPSICSLLLNLSDIGQAYRIRGILRRRTSDANRV